MLTYSEFNKIYLEEAHQVMEFINDDILQELKKHNDGWNESKDWFVNYLQQSSLRYYKLYVTAINNKSKSIIDVGGFWAIFPITMARLGFEVKMTEALKYYSSNYNAFFEFVKSKKITIVDFDPFMEEYQGDTFDMITVMAVIEHYPHSLKFFFNNIKKMMHEDSTLCLDVPNLAFIKTRINFLFGKTPLTPIEIIYNSATPFIGHHHEFTVPEIKTLMKLCNLKLTKLVTHNYTPNRMLTFKNIIKNPLVLLNLFFEGTREVIYIEAKKQ